MANTHIQIDILSDVVCPWCVIGYKRLFVAIRELGLQEQVSIHWHPFELNPLMPPAGENLRQHLAEKYGTTLNGSIAARQQLTALGHAVGFQFNYFDEMRMFNTRKAHLLLQWVKETECQTQLADAIFRAYFSEQRDISEEQTLLSLVEAMGLDTQSASRIFQDSAQERALVDAEQQWLNNGFHAVPVMIFGGTNLLSGAQEVDTYKQVLSEFSGGTRHV